MGDLKTPFHDAVLTTVDPGGNDIPSRGGDPLVDDPGGAGLTSVMWPDAPVKLTDKGESANSQSGLPGMPSRMAPSPASPPMPPSLDERSPTTINEK